MYSKLSKTFQISDYSIPKLLSPKEFFKLESTAKKKYFRSLFQKHQTGAREICNDLHVKPTTETSSSSIYPSGTSSFSVYPSGTSSFSVYPSGTSSSSV
ncbi:uncharacterized protein J8A68_001890 [[Candida] subhashii]|uniref:Uncharacterized protein n=1 Tax=[Candida] subhashii TaxID=561895 RepID=A0A8J5UYU3_9ASCO|nr:uncharacterized protein J8A68_001890 [[Candida] subhashii]KAG7664595.1 hypothetical protein J8A68_001890 [[Candida] subhashii]